MSKENFESLVLGFLKGEILEVYEANSEDEITVNLKDVNYKTKGIEWEKSLQERLSQYNYNVQFSYGDGDWVTVHLKL